MVIIDSAVLNGEKIIVCTNTQEYDDELERHGNMVIYHPQEIKQMMNHPPEKIRELHELKKYAQKNRNSPKGKALMAAHEKEVMEMVEDVFPGAKQGEMESRAQDRPLSMAEMRKKIKKES